MHHYEGLCEKDIFTNNKQDNMIMAPLEEQRKVTEMTRPYSKKVL